MLAETGSRYLSDLAEIVTITGRFSMIIFVGRWRRGRTRRRVAWQPDSFFFSRLQLGRNDSATQTMGKGNSGDDGTLEVSGMEGGGGGIPSLPRHHPHSIDKHPSNWYFHFSFSYFPLSVVD